MSKWPKGRYALLTPNEGCPESEAHGWRRGYVSFTWKEPRVFESANKCDMDSYLHNTEEEIVENKDMPCKHDLTTNTWPNHKTNLLGPFSKYTMRLNFCCKEKSTSNNPYDWPQGSFMIFGYSEGCPTGMIIYEMVCVVVVKTLPTFHTNMYRL